MIRRIMGVAVILLVVSGGASATVADDAPGRILVIGDSLTIGLSASGRNLSFAPLVADEMVMALGIDPDMTLDAIIDTWDDWGWRDVDYVIVQTVLHDIGGESTIPANEWGSAYGGMLDMLYADTGATIIVCTSFWGGFREGTTNYDNAMIYNALIMSEAGKRYFVRLADLWAETYECEECLSANTDQTPFARGGFLGDSFHPGDYGHSVIAGVIIGAMDRRYIYYFPIVVK